MEALAMPVREASAMPVREALAMPCCWIDWKTRQCGDSFKMWVQFTTGNSLEVVRDYRLG
jgi:hypothetical protein